MNVPLISLHRAQDSGVEMSKAKQAKARPKCAKQQTPHRQLKQLQKQQEARAGMAKKLSVAVEDLDNVGSYLFIAMQALRTGDGDGALLVRDALTVMGDAYERLLMDVCSSVAAVLDELDPDGAEQRRQQRS